MKNKARLLFMSIFTATVICCALSVLSFSAESREIADRVLRMHVVANSDSAADQQLKLKVRDAVLEEGREIFEGSRSRDEAEKRLSAAEERLKLAAERVVAENGYLYPVRINIGRTFFTARTYSDRVTLPAGNYEAVNVIIGEGKGHNWWCVMFPPMCLPAAQSDAELSDVLDDGQLKLTSSEPELEPRFKLLEIYEKFIEKIK